MSAAPRYAAHRRQVEGADPVRGTQRGSIRYNALRDKLDGISNTVLASALRELERDGLVTRQEYLEVPVRVEYSPTDACRELLPILEQLSDWAEKRM